MKLYQSVYWCIFMLFISNILILGSLACPFLKIKIKLRLLIIISLIKLGYETAKKMFYSIRKFTK